MVPRSWVISVVIRSDEDCNEIIFTPGCLLWLFETAISKGYGLALGTGSSYQSRFPGCVSCVLPGGTRVGRNGLPCRPKCRGAAQLVGGSGHTVLSWCSSLQDHGLVIRDPPNSSRACPAPSVLHWAFESEQGIKASVWSCKALRMIQQGRLGSGWFVWVSFFLRTPSKTSEN